MANAKDLTPLMKMELRFAPERMSVTYPNKTKANLEERGLVRIKRRRPDHWLWKLTVEGVAARDRLKPVKPEWVK